MRGQRIVGGIYGMKYSSKGQKGKNGHKNRIKRSGQSRLVYVKDMSLWRLNKQKPPERKFKTDDIVLGCHIEFVSRLDEFR